MMLNKTSFIPKVAALDNHPERHGSNLAVPVRRLRSGYGPAVRCRTDLVAVQPQVFDLLAYLIRHRNQVVTKDDLLKVVWNRRIVSDSAVTTRINAVRSAIGDNGQSQRLIRTLPRKGFRFVGEVNEEQAPLGNAAGATSPESNALVSQDDPLPAEPRPDREPPRVALTLPKRPSIAVLPFMTMSNDPEQANFADGIVDDIITALSHLRWLFVISRSSTFTYKHRAVDVKQVSRELGVRYVLEGSVRKASDRLRISAQLIEAEHGTHVWARRYERSLKDIFALQDEITDSIAAALEPEISASERDRARRKAPESLGAWRSISMGCGIYYAQPVKSRRRRATSAKPLRWIQPLQRPTQRSRLPTFIKSHA